MVLKFKAKDSDKTASPLCFSYISSDFSVDNMKRTGLYGRVYDFLVDYNSIDVDDVLNIHKYLK